VQSTFYENSKAQDETRKKEREVAIVKENEMKEPKGESSKRTEVGVKEVRGITPLSSLRGFKEPEAKSTQSSKRTLSSLSLSSTTSEKTSGNKTERSALPKRQKKPGQK
jgi:hypothetical protein